MSKDHKDELKSDSTLMEKVWTFTKEKKGGKVETLRNTLLLETTCPIKSLTLSKQELNEDLWDSLTKHGVEELIITQDGDLIVYETRVLKRLLEKEPPIETLTETCTLKFTDGNELTETIANIILCGKILHDMYEDSGFHDDEGRVIPFVNKSITNEVMERILKEVKTGERSIEENDKVACDYLDYSKWAGIPEGAIGPEQWKEVGFDVKEVPELPGNIDEILKSDCLYFEGKKVSETHELVLMPGGLSINNIGKLTKHLREGDY